VKKDNDRKARDAGELVATSKVQRIHKTVELEVRRG